MAIVTAFYEYIAGPADGGVVELPWAANECVLERVLEHAPTGSEDGDPVRTVRPGQPSGHCGFQTSGRTPITK